MKTKLFSIALIFVSALAYAAPATMRLDYYHTGNSKQELFSFDRVVIEPLPWPGNPAKPMDDSNLGNYLFEVHARATGQLLYSRGFSTLFGELVTTDEAKTPNLT